MGRPLATVGAFALLLFALAGAALAADEPPNVIFIVADDLGYGDVGCYGSTLIPTPNIDALAASGVRFTDGYVAAAVCSPSRAGFLTGRYPSRHGFEFNFAQRDDVEGLALEERTMADALKAAGYSTGMVGKWHQGKSHERHPLSRGFDEFFGFLEGATTFVTPRTPDAVSLRLADGGDAKIGERGAKILRGREVVPEDAYLTDAFTREAEAFIDGHRADPFFLYLSYNAPHTPLEAKQSDVDAFAHIADRKTRVFAAMVKALDDGVGRVTAKLEELGLRENTLIAFISDNGGALYVGGASSNAPYNGGKRFHYEGGLRVPFILSWPDRLSNGRVESRPVISLDLLPTFVAAAGNTPSAELDGVDLMPSLSEEGTGTPHETLFWRASPNRAVRKGNWKLCLVNRAAEGLESQLDPVSGRLPMKDYPATSPLGQVELLFDLSIDPGERHNLAIERPEIVRALRADLSTWESDTVPPAWPCRRSKVIERDGTWLQLFF